jgi:hypothetical protein
MAPGPQGPEEIKIVRKKGFTRGSITQSAGVRKLFEGRSPLLKRDHIDSGEERAVEKRRRKAETISKRKTEGFVFKPGGPEEEAASRWKCPPSGDRTRRNRPLPRAFESGQFR